MCDYTTVNLGSHTESGTGPEECVGINRISGNTSLVGGENPAADFSRGNYLLYGYMPEIGLLICQIPLFNSIIFSGYDFFR